MCAEEGSEEKINKEHLPLILCLAHCLCLRLKVGVVRKYERGYHCTYCMLASIYPVWGKNTQEGGYSYGTERTRVYLWLKWVGHL